MKRYEALYMIGTEVHSCYIPARSQCEARIKAQRKGMKITGQWLVEEIEVSEGEMNAIMQAYARLN
jgi:hypothetical protein